jgi:hypothetical protein
MIEALMVGRMREATWAPAWRIRMTTSWGQ